MHKKLLFGISVICWCNVVFGNTDSRRKHECSYDLEKAYIEYSNAIPGVLFDDNHNGISHIQDVADGYIIGRNIRYDFIANFTDLKSYHDKHIAEITSLSNFDLDIKNSASEEAFLEKIASFRRQVSGIDNLSYRLESEFSRLSAEFYIPNLGRSINKINTIKVKMEQANCQDFELQKPVNEILNDLSLWWGEIHKIKNYIADFQQKRTHLIDYVAKTYNSKMEKGYSDAIVQDLDSVRNMILKAFVINDFHTEVELWWYGKYDTMDNYWSSRYLNIHKSLEVSYQRLGEAKYYRKEWEKLRGILDGVVLDQISVADYRIEVLDNWISKIEALKWEDYLELQEDNVNRRLAILDRLPKICEAVLRNFLFVVPQINSMQDFTLAEERYKRVIDACGKRETDQSLALYNERVLAIKELYKKLGKLDPTDDEILSALIHLENMGFEKLESQLVGLVGERK